jgi:serine/threonine-protein kinase
MSEDCQPDTVNEPANDPLLDAALSAAFGPDEKSGTQICPLSLRDPPDEDFGPPVKPNSSEHPASGVAGHNQLFGEIARGGMGAILRGRDPRLGRELAVKVLLEAHRDKPELVQRFLEEAQIGGQLQHPGVVPVYELGNFADDRPFFTMKLVKGQTFAKVLGQRSSPQQDLPRLLTVFEQVCQTVAYAHARGVIHRDLKPANVMVGGFGEVQVMDWGLAKVLPRGGVADEPSPVPEEATVIQTARSGSTAEASQPGTVLGTPAFMPPEQARGEVARLDERADVFSLGGMLCVILTGQPPYTGSANEVHRRGVEGDLADAIARLDGCGTDSELVGLCKECLAVERDNRPRDAGVVAARMAAYQAGVRERLRQAELERAAAQARATEERKRRRVTAALAVAVLGLIAGGGGAFVWLQRQRAEQRQAVIAALDKAAEWQQRARWDEARALIDQAADRLGRSGPDDLRERVEQARADLNLARRLDAIQLKATLRLTKKSHLAATVNAINEEYKEAFMDADTIPFVENVEVVAARIRASAIRDRLVAELDFWAALATSERREWLLKLAREADPDPLRDRLRDPEVWADPNTLRALVNELLLDEETKGTGLSPELMVVLGGLLWRDREDIVPLLMAAQARYPSDFWFNFWLGAALIMKNDPEEADGYFRAAIAIRSDIAGGYSGLGATLAGRGRQDEALAAFRKAVELDPEDFYAQGGLGITFLAQGRLVEARGALRRCLELIPEGDSFRDVMAPHLQTCESWITLDGKLAAILKGDARPENALEQVELAGLCQQRFKHLYATAAYFYAEAFKDMPELANDPSNWNRYNAACDAALAGCGQGKDAAKLDDRERARLRTQALDWLKADLALWADRAKSNRPADRESVQQTLELWQTVSSLEGVRRRKSLEKLPEAERDEWRKLWRDVAALHVRVEGKGAR